jgi:hypothetical protein
MILELLEAAGALLTPCLYCALQMMILSASFILLNNAVV